MYFQILLCYFLSFFCLWYLILVQVNQIEIKINRLKSLEEANVAKFRPTLKAIQNVDSKNSSLDLIETSINDNNYEKEHPGCPICRTTADAFIFAVRNGYTDLELKRMSKPLCDVLEIYNKTMCAELIDMNFDIAKYIINLRPYLTGQLICGIMLQDHNCVYKDTTPEWNVKISKLPSMIIGSKSYMPNAGVDKLKVVQITDMHYDPKYKEGSNAGCKTPVCCRNDLKNIDLVNAKAGKWGDYRNCDSPWLALENVFSEINKKHKNIDVIYATGDYIHHAVWETTITENIESIQKTIDAIKHRFPQVPFYPILGNHEPHPANVFAPHSMNRTDFSSKPLYNFLSESWYWLSDSAKETLLLGGYYTDLIRPGFRVIALNNNACNQFNLWLLFDSSFLIKELQWLHDTLLAAERNQEKVHILAHYPSGHPNCYRRWAREYKRIVERFWHTISGQFNGHTHRDEFTLYYHKGNPKHAINVAWNGGSATTYSFVNPNYRIYSVEAETYQVLDHETWIYNLTEANKYPHLPPRWFKEYSFRKAFHMNDLSPASLQNLLADFATNPKKLHQYWSFNIKMSDPHLKHGCNNECMADLLCKMTVTEYRDVGQCKHLLDIYWKSVLN